jgi:hypothetical protein
LLHALFKRILVDVLMLEDINVKSVQLSAKKTKIYVLNMARSIKRNLFEAFDNMSILQMKHISIQRI